MAKAVKFIPREQPRYRYAQVDAATADDQKRTLQVAFSSEFPVERTASARDEKLGIAKRGEDYLELLSHNDGDFDLSALNAPGAVVDEHDTTRHLGKVTHAEVSADKKGRAVLELDGISELSKEISEAGENPQLETGAMLQAAKNNAQSAPMAAMARMFSGQQGAGQPPATSQPAAA